MDLIVDVLVDLETFFPHLRISPEAFILQKD